MNKKAKRKNIIAIIILSIILIIIAIYAISQVTFVGTNIKYGFPTFSSYKCDQQDVKTITTDRLGSGGVLLSKVTIPYSTNSISDIKGYVDAGGWNSLIADFRIRYQICDVDGNNCGASNYIQYANAGTKNLNIAFNPEEKSYRFWGETRIITIFASWKYDSSIPVTITYNAVTYGISLADGTPISNTCKLDSTEITTRGDLVWDCQGNTECLSKGTPGLTSLGFLKYAPYVQSWSTITASNLQQYNGATNTFCFDGMTYTGKSLTTISKAYTYPDITTQRKLACCPGDIITSGNSEKICSTTGNLIVIGNDDTCKSTNDCPNDGQAICDDRLLISGYACGSKDINGVGVCEIKSSQFVECCSNDDCDSAGCNINTHECIAEPIAPLPTSICGNSILESLEQCDDGNTISGDGCSSICKIEEVIVESECSSNSDCQANYECQSGSCISTTLCEKFWQGNYNPITGCSIETWFIIVLIFIAIIILLVIFTLIKKLYTPIRRK